MENSEKPLAVRLRAEIYRLQAEVRAWEVAADTARRYCFHAGRDARETVDWLRAEQKRALKRLLE